MRTILLLIVLMAFPMMAHAGDMHLPDFEGEDFQPRIWALNDAVSLMGCLLDDDMDQAYHVAEGAYIWQQPGVALTITAQWTDPVEPPQLWLAESTMYRFFIANHNTRLSTPFFMPSEAEYNVDDPAIPDMICLLDADKALERFQRHYEGYLMWVSMNEGMEFIEPELSSVDFTGAVVFIHAGGALELYYVIDPDRGIHLTHFMIYDYFSA